MEPWKGHALHLQALALLPRDLNWRCRIVGGPQRPEEQRYMNGLKALTAQLALDTRVQFVGESAHVETEFAAADIFCQPNTGPEPFGLVFIEALAAGLPVVSTSLGATPEIVDATCGFLAPPGHPASVAAALEQLLRDRSLRDQLGSAAPARARALCDPTTQLPLLFELLK